MLSVLKRLAKRYGHRQALMGIEIINEPNTTTSWPMMNVTERYKAVDPELAEGTGPIGFDWLKDFYVTAYHRLRDADKGALPADKAVVFHDGFDIEQWKDFMRGDDGKLAPEFENVVLDTHQYLMTAEMMGCPQTVEGYDDFVRNAYAPMIAEMSEYFPVIVGEWCLFNSVGCGVDTHGGQSVLNGEEGAQAETLTADRSARCTRAWPNPSSPHGARAAASTTGTTSCSPTPSTPPAGSAGTHGTSGAASPRTGSPSRSSPAFRHRRPRLRYHHLLR